MVKAAYDPVRKLPRYLRTEDLPVHTFTPQTYQLELLDAALHQNTIVCVNSPPGKTFIAVMLIKEMAIQIRPMVSDTTKRKFTVFLVSSVNVESQAKVVCHHTDLSVGYYSDNTEIKADQADKWIPELLTHQVFVTTASVFLNFLQCEFLSLTQINLLLIDECSDICISESHKQVMKIYEKYEEHLQPRIVVLTAVLLSSKCRDPTELENTINKLESIFHSIAETSTLVFSERHGTSPKENVLECNSDFDEIQQMPEVSMILQESLFFIDECILSEKEKENIKDPLQVPRTALAQCLNILDVLGPWCANHIAEMFIKQLEKIIGHEQSEIGKLLLRYTTTQLRILTKTFEKLFNIEYCIDDFLPFLTPKVIKLVNILRGYKPEFEFVILRDENADGIEHSDDDTMDDLSDSDSDDYVNSSHHKNDLHITLKHPAAARAGFSDSDPLEQEEEKRLCGLIFVDCKYVAYALNKVIEEICAWDENMCFVKNGHITGYKYGAKRESTTYRKHEEVLRKFRMQEINVLVATSNFEECIDIPKCNLVVCFDPPKDYKSYSQSKSRARARNASFLMLIDSEKARPFLTELNTYKRIEQVLLRKYKNKVEPSKEELLQILEQHNIPQSVVLNTNNNNNNTNSNNNNNNNSTSPITLFSAISIVNRYCAKLPSDAFTHLTPKCTVEKINVNNENHYVATLKLPINSPVKKDVKGDIMPREKLAKMSAALKMCQELQIQGELDDHFLPVGKEILKHDEKEALKDPLKYGEEDDVEWEEEEEEELIGSPRPGTTKRKQYYFKKAADALINNHVDTNQLCCLYNIHMVLTGPITEEQNTRGRKIYVPENTPRGFGILSLKNIPQVPCFPVYTRSGEVTVSLDMVESNVSINESQLNKLTIFHRFVFSTVLRLEKDPIDFMPDEAKVGYLIVPLIEDENGHHINWNFVNEVQFSFSRNHPDIYDSKREKFKFCIEDFEDAVVMPSYRNMDQPQHFYVAEIKYDLNPNSPFPSPELYRTFNEYYSKKYGLHITNLEQPLLDVDHTSARLNLLTPRYMNQKGIALPTSSAETKKARRENLQQKQILIPELCVVHIFPASLWRKAVCLPAILYRINYLLIAEEIRVKVAQGTKIGVIEIPKGFQFPKLDFGFETNPEKIIDNKTESEMKVTKAKENGPCTSSSKTTANDSNKLIFKDTRENNELIRKVSGSSLQKITFEKRKDIKEMPIREMVNNVECKKFNYRKPFIKSNSTESLPKTCNKEDYNRPLKDSNRIQEALNAAAGKNNFERREDSVSTSSSRGYSHSDIKTFKSCSVNNSEEKKSQPQQFTNKKKHEKEPHQSNENIKEENLKEEKNSKSFSKSTFTNLQNSSRIPNGSKMDFKITFDIAKDLNPKDSLDSFKETTEVPSNVKFQNDTLKKDLESLDIRLICDNRSYPEGNAFHQMDEQIRKEKKASKTFGQLDNFYQTKSNTSEMLNYSTKIVEITDSEEDHHKDNIDKLSNGNCDKSELKNISPTFSPKKDPVCKTSVQNSNNQAGYSPIVETCKELKNNFNNARLHSSDINICHTNMDSVKDVEEKLCSNSKENEENLKTCTSISVSPNKDQQCHLYSASKSNDSVVLHSNSTATAFNPTQEKTLSTASSDSVSSSSHQLTTPNLHSLSLAPEQMCNHSNSSNQSIFNCTQSASSLIDDDKTSSDSEITPCQTEQIASHLEDSNDQLEVAVQDVSVSAPLHDRDQNDAEAVSPPIVIHTNNNVIQSNCPVDAKVPLSNINKCTSPLSSHENAICDITRHNSDTDVFQNITSFSGKSAAVDMTKISDYGQFDDTTNANLVYSYAEAQEKLAQSSNTPPLLLDTDIELSCYIGPSPCIILQALTMSNANDFFSLERLETIGDSFLKYAITVYLYCQYPGIHEGKLSYLRSKQVSNYNLYRLGRKKGLPERMVSAKFEPYENWLPPGYVINEDRRRGPVHKVHISSSSNKQDSYSSGNQCGSESVEEEILSTSFNDEKLSSNLNNGMMNFIENKKIPSHVRKANLEQWKFNQELEELKQSQEQDGVSGCGSSTNEKPLVPYSLQTIHSIPDKSVADCVEALIGCYLTCCGKRAALLFMSWLGLKVLPQKHILDLQEQFDEDITDHQLDELETPLSPLLTHTINAKEVLERLLDGYETFEKEIGYKFSDRSYLLQAFTHASYHYNTVTDCYQRLEFLGDAILDYVITRHLYEDSQRYSPGVLTDLRSALVNNNIFAALAVKWNFHKFFKAISPELFNVIERFVARQKEKEDEIDFDEEFQDEVEENPDEEVVEMEIPKALGDIFESVAGAIYLDSNRSLDVVWKVYYRIMKPQIEKYLKSIPKSPVRELLELEPETAKFEKPERTVNGKIRVTVKVAGKGVYHGVGRNYRIAKSAAAKKALRILKTMQSQGLIAQISNEKMMQG